MVGHFQEFEDEYLEMMYEFHEAEPGGVVRTGDLAAKLSVSPASATEMVQRLATRGFLEYIPYKGARLTPQGLTHGQKMKRRHRLAEVLLDMLPYDGNPTRRLVASSTPLMTTWKSPFRGSSPSTPSIRVDGRFLSQRLTSLQDCRTVRRTVRWPIWRLV